MNEKIDAKKLNYVVYRISVMQCKLWFIQYVYINTINFNIEIDIPIYFCF